MRSTSRPLSTSLVWRLPSAFCQMSLLICRVTSMRKPDGTARGKHVLSVVGRSGTQTYDTTDGGSMGYLEEVLSSGFELTGPPSASTFGEQQFLEDEGSETRVRSYMQQDTFLFRHTKKDQGPPPFTGPQLIVKEKEKKKKRRSEKGKDKEKK